MSAAPDHQRSFDARTAELIQQAHRCDTLPQVDEYLPFRNFGEMWSMHVAENADRLWMHYYPCETDDESPVRFTYGAFSELIDRVAALLRFDYAIGEGDSIATLTINQPLTIAIYFAAWRLGARVVPLNPSESDERAAYIVQNSGTRLLIAHTSCRKDLAPLDGLLPDDLRRSLVLDGAERAGALQAGWDDFLAALADVDVSREMPPAPDISWDAEALVVYTSGTTGNPKGVVLSQKQMFADAYAIAQWHAIDPHTVMMNVLPIHHVNGIMVTLLTPAFAGAQVVVNKRFRSRGFWPKLARHDVQIVSVVPTLLQFLIEANDDFNVEDVPNFRHFICGAGPLSVEVARAFQDTFGLKIVHGYGLSETVCYSCFLPTDLPWHEHNAWMYDHGFPSIGVPIVTNEMAIHDPDGCAVAEGERGEIVIRGHNVMIGYFQNPEVNAETFKHGWFRSGDEGFMRRGDDGRPYFFITGRIKELIIRGGVNISPFEIDEVLCGMPGVRVGLAVGFENRYYGEEVGAYVQVEPGKTLTEQVILDYCRTKLSAAKSPKVVVFGEDIPVTSTGKYQRGRLRDLFAAFKDRQFRG